MITFDLVCENGHDFEGWFENSEEYERQCRDGLVICPFCDSSNVNKVLSPVGFIRNKSIPKPVNKNNSLENQIQNLDETIKNITNYIDKNFEDVGSDFAEKALKIHYGVDEPKNIRGTTTKEEEKTLKDEGIGFISIPETKKEE